MTPEEYIDELKWLEIAIFRLEDAIEALSYTSHEFKPLYNKVCDVQKQVDITWDRTERAFCKAYPEQYKDWYEKWQVMKVDTL